MQKQQGKMSLTSFKKYIKPLISNKFFLATLAFIVWITVFDQNSLIDRYRLAKRISQLEKQKQHYIDEIEQNNRKMEELQSNLDNLEKFAREEYLMKKKDEVIFVVEEE
ncbi:FtsB family cell division protein [Carboxylicivirga litoralis]|uniref:FtsB family cell division protein n=1 Tax=Carboxylicivirga litoralis TaxID=2816963 RepID=UPI0021CAE4F1|nr:septum formation initiator family protein [Carboxylicivirga sp. A043]